MNASIFPVIAAMLVASLHVDAETNATPPGVMIVLVGDSTVTDTAGWGLGFKQFLKQPALCVNRAVGGRSSMSFIKEGRWEKALALKADYYLIQFGHNDQPGKPGRSTDANTDYRAYMTRYVDEARAIGARPVLVTSLVRREFDQDDPHKINSSLDPYVKVVKEIAAQKNVPLIDLHARSKAFCELVGREKCLEFSPFTVTGTKTNYDSTHLNAKGGVEFARLAVDELRTAIPALSGYLRDEPGSLARPKVYDVGDFGANGDGDTVDTAAIQRALDVCGQGGGGIVKLTPGIYLCTPIFLRCNTTLHLDAGAILQATDNPDDFADPHRAGTPLALVNGSGLNAIAINGTGVIDGAGERWWAPVRALKQAGEPEPRRRPRLVILSNCVDVRMEDVTLQNSPSFHLVPVDCENVSISGMVVQAPQDAPNTDAVDPSACRYVMIHDCIFDVGDDDIALKSSHADISHPNAACEHVTIRDCAFLHGHGMSIGSETLGGVQDVRMENCMFKGTTSGIRIKSARGRGGLVANLVYRDLKMTDVDWPVYFTSYYPRVPVHDESQPMATDSPVYRDIRIENVTASSEKIAGEIIGLPESAISNVVFESVQISAPKGMTFRNARGIEFRDSAIKVEEGLPLNLETNATVIGLP